MLCRWPDFRLCFESGPGPAAIVDETTLDIGAPELVIISRWGAWPMACSRFLCCSSSTLPVCELPLKRRLEEDCFCGCKFAYYCWGFPLFVACIDVIELCCMGKF